MQPQTSFALQDPPALVLEQAWEQAWQLVGGLAWGPLAEMEQDPLPVHPGPGFRLMHGATLQRMWSL